MKSEVPEMDHKRLIHYDVVDRKPFMFTSRENRVGIQL